MGDSEDTTSTTIPLYTSQLKDIAAILGCSADSLVITPIVEAANVDTGAQVSSETDVSCNEQQIPLPECNEQPVDIPSNDQTLIVPVRDSTIISDRSGQAMYQLVYENGESRWIAGNDSNINLHSSESLADVVMSDSVQSSGLQENSNVPDSHPETTNVTFSFNPRDFSSMGKYDHVSLQGLPVTSSVGPEIQDGFHLPKLQVKSPENDVEAAALDRETVVKMTESGRAHCDECNKSFKRPWYLTVHKRAFHGLGNPFTCEICSKQFTSSWGLKNHYSVHSDDRPYHCTKCSAKFKRNYELNKHMRSHVVEKAFACNICGQSFACEAYLKMHKYSHGINANYACGVCGKKFGTPFKVKEHFQIVHNPARPVSCPLCDKTFKRRADMNVHLASHSSQKSHVCNDCGKAFHRQRALREHQLIHAKILPYPCDVCNRSFKTPREFSRHNAFTHMPYPCSQCHQSFMEPEKFEEHIHNHTLGIFPCPECPASFKTVERLERHFLHHGKKPAQCAGCQAVFSTAGNLAKHNSSFAYCEVCNTCIRKVCLEKHIGNGHTKAGSRVVVGKVKKKLKKGVTRRKPSSKRKEKNVANKDETPGDLETDPVVDLGDSIASAERKSARGLVCDVCGEYFATEFELEQHEKVHFSTTVMFSCQICSEQFADKSVMKQHLKVHYKTSVGGKEQELTCHICNRVFRRKAALIKHIRDHDREAEDDESSDNADENDSRGEENSRYCFGDTQHNLLVGGSRGKESSEHSLGDTSHINSLVNGSGNDENHIEMGDIEYVNEKTESVQLVSSHDGDNEDIVLVESNSSLVNTNETEDGRIEPNEDCSVVVIKVEVEPSPTSNA